MLGPLSFLLFAAFAFTQELRFSSISKSGVIGVTNIPSESVLTLERSDQFPEWEAQRSWILGSNSLSFTVPLAQPVQFYRARALEIPPTPQGFSNLTRSYSVLTTIAGTGRDPAAKNKWKPEFEGGPATQAELSRPHIAMADQAGNIFIADKEGHAIRKIKTDGTIVTVAGTNSSGNGPDTPTPGTSVALNEPNGLWVASTGIVYILDLGNGKVRKLGPNGQTRTVFTLPGGISIGRGIWVRDDEKLAFVCSGTEIKRWTPTDGLTTFASGFNSLGNLAIDYSKPIATTSPGELAGRLVVTDRGAHRVYRFEPDGSRTPIAGNGTTVGGGDGQPALATGLAGVRAVWFFASGAFFIVSQKRCNLFFFLGCGYIKTEI
jgi:hypothetical protein